jgi:DNA-binding transcriptional regulator/RsmH inhibitor MraZ
MVFTNKVIRHMHEFALDEQHRLNLTSIHMMILGLQKSAKLV